MPQRAEGRLPDALLFCMYLNGGGERGGGRRCMRGRDMRGEGREVNTVNKGGT